ncbi:MAG: transporter associated domain-containing protein [Thermomicrobiales bacterium]
MLAQLGHIPVPGEHFVVESWKFEVVDMDGRRVDKVLAVRDNEEEQRHSIGRAEGVRLKMRRLFCESQLWPSSWSRLLGKALPRGDGVRSDCLHNRRSWTDRSHRSGRVLRRLAGAKVTDVAVGDQAVGAVYLSGRKASSLPRSSRPKVPDDGQRAWRRYRQRDQRRRRDRRSNLRAAPGRNMR